MLTILLPPSGKKIAWRHKLPWLKVRVNTDALLYYGGYFLQIILYNRLGI